VDAAGNVSDSYAYDAFGLMLGGNPTAANPSLTPLLHNSEMYGSGSGMYYLRARSYDPGVGRFTSVDPVAGRLDQPETLHRYIFGANDPVNNVDPSGELSLAATIGVVAIIGILVATAIGSIFSGPGSPIGGDMEVFKARVRYAGCPAWPHVLRSANPKEAKETARLIRHFEEWYLANQYNMQHLAGGALAVWASWACVDHAVHFAQHLRSVRNQDPELPLLTFYRAHIMGEAGALGTIFGGYGHTFLIVRKRGLATNSPDDIGINFDSWFFYSSAPTIGSTYYDSATDVSNEYYSEYSDLY
jgi:RHS repeat-associated protein